MIPPDLNDALLSLAPDASWSHGGDYESIVWCSDDIKKPTKKQVVSELKRLTDEYNAHEYRRKRAAEYPPIGDQLDDLLKQGAFSDEMRAKLLAVKERFPK
jgi:hypothetical protein